MGSFLNGELHGQGNEWRNMTGFRGGFVKGLRHGKGETEISNEEGACEYTDEYYDHGAKIS